MGQTQSKPSYKDFGLFCESYLSSPEIELGIGTNNALDFETGVEVFISTAKDLDIDSISAMIENFKTSQDVYVIRNASSELRFLLEELFRYQIVNSGEVDELLVCKVKESKDLFFLFLVWFY